MLSGNREKKTKKTAHKGKYQILMQGVLLVLLFGIAFILLLLFTSLFYQRSHHDWLERQHRTAWYERDGFRTRIRLVDTEIQSLSTDSDFLAFADSDTAYSYSTIKAFKKIAQNTNFFTDGASSLAVTTSYPDSRVVMAEGTLSKEQFLKGDLDLSEELYQQVSEFFYNSASYFMQIPLLDEQGALAELLRCYRRTTQSFDLIFMARLKPDFFLKNSSDLPFILLEDGRFLAQNQLASADDLRGRADTESVREAVFRLRRPEYVDDAIIVPAEDDNYVMVYHLPDTSLDIGIFLSEPPVKQPYVIAFILISIPLFAASALFISRTISKRLYKPIAIALEPLEGEQEAEPEPETEDEEGRKETSHARPNELELIRRRIQNYQKIAEDLTSLQKEHALYRDLTFYSNLLEGVILPEYKDSDLLKEIEAGSHTVLILEFIDTGDAESVVLHQEIQAAFSRDNACRLVAEGPLRFVMIYLDTPQDTAVSHVKDHIQEIEPALPWYTAVSECRRAAEGLERSYLECLQLLDFRYRLPENNFLYVKDMPSTVSDYYYYPVSEEQRLTRLIVDGNEDALALFDKLWRDNTIQRALGAEARRDFIFALVHTFRRSAQELKINLNQLPAVRHDLAEQIQNNWQEPEIVNDLRELLQALVSYKNVRGSSQDEILKEKMFTFIEKNYYDDIMLNDLADYLGFTPKYCSVLFPKLLGMNFKEFLNRYRITQATRILKEDPDILINDLAATVGFNSANSFIRVFRQYTGTTPGRYLKD